MRRRVFFGMTPVALGCGWRAMADAPMPMVTLGKSGLRVSRFVLGGYHMRARGEENAIKMIHRAVELGVNFFDSAWLYNNGESDAAYGKAFTPSMRQRVLLMGKAERRTAAGAMQQLEDTLRRMKTDYLDLWQCHQVVEMAEIDKIHAPGGAIEAFVKAKQQGKVRHIGFTGHRDPAVLEKMLATSDVWETVQHPVNLIDPHYLSFIKNVVPKVRAKGLGMLAMKSNGMGSIGKAGIAPIAECLRFTLSQEVDVVVSGPETVEQLEENIGVVKAFKPMTKAEIDALLARTAKGAHGAKIERYKRPESGAMHAPHHDGEALSE